MDEPLENTVSSEEKILWKGRRNHKVLMFYFFTSLFCTFLVAILFFLNENISHSAFNGRTTSGHSMSILTVIVGVIISIVIYNSKKKCIYIITNKKTIIKKEGLNSEVTYIEHVDVVSINLTKKGLNTFFNVGTINIDSGKVEKKEIRKRAISGMNVASLKPKIIYDEIKHIENPSKVYNLLKRIVELNKQSEITKIGKDETKEAT